MKTHIYILLLLTAAAFISGEAPVSSANYTVEESTIDGGGGEAASANYSVRATIGQTGAGTVSSADYDNLAGYIRPGFTALSIDSLSAVPASAAPGEEVTFTLTYSGGSANQSFAWDMGDGTVHWPSVGTSSWMGSAVILSGILRDNVRGRRYHKRARLRCQRQIRC